MSLKLTKDNASHTLNLVKDAAPVNIHVNLKWLAAKQGFHIFGGSQKEDLDLGCMYETVSGEKGVIQALGNLFGSKSAAPFISLDKDDRDGNSDDGENLFITRPDTLKRVLIFAYIYAGSAFKKVDAKVALEISNGETVEIDLDAPDRSHSFCAVAQVLVEGGQVRLLREEKYFNGHEECDAAYGFGFQWVKGSKD